MGKKKGGGKQFQLNDRVFAKVKGHAPWPGCIMAVKGSRYKIFFYGTYDQGNCQGSDIFHYNDASIAKFVSDKAKNRPKFKEALEEIENNPAIGYSRTEEEFAGQVPLEGGVSGETMLEESSANISALDDTMEEEEESKETPKEPVKIEEPPAAVEAPKVTKKAAKPVEKPVETPVAEVKEEASNKPVPAKKGTKRKASENSPLTPVTPAAKQPKVATPTAASAAAGAAPATSTPLSSAVPEEKTSRSGRVIKPKKFNDENETPKMNTVSSSTSTTSNNRRASTTSVKVEDGTPNSRNVVKKTTGSQLESALKIWVQVKATNDSIEIDLGKKKPAQFESKEQELEWDRTSAKNALKFKQLVESGQFIPDEIRQKLENKLKRTPEEEQILKQGLELANHREKVRWIKVEQKIFELDVAIRMALHYQEPQMERCLILLHELQTLAIEPLMLKKFPDVVTTVRKMRKYMGPKDPQLDAKAAKKRSDEIDKIRVKAHEMYEKIQGLFPPVPANINFATHFQRLVDEFRNVTKDLDQTKIAQIVMDPTLA